MRALWRNEMRRGWGSKFWLFGLAMQAVLSGGPLFAQNSTTAIPIDPARAIQQQWAKDLGPAADGLKASSRDGVVTLSGTVNNLLVRDQALNIAASTIEVRQVIDLLQVGPEARPDAAIQEDAQRALRLDPVTRDWAIQPTVREGTVTLQGEVSHWGEKAGAQEVVKGVRGVRAIDNKISIQPVAAPLDVELETDIRQFLSSDRALAPNHLQVQVLDGRATIRGPVKNLPEKQRAAQIAWSAGATAVDDTQVQVNPLAASAMGWGGPESEELRGYGSSTALPADFSEMELRRSDVEIQREIRQALRDDPQLRHESITVIVQGGQVFLKGQVKNIDRRVAAFNRAYIPGVSRVDLTGLTVREKPRKVRIVGASAAFSTGRPDQSVSNFAPADEDLKQAVRAALITDVRIAPYMVMVDVQQRKVILTGGVDNMQAKRAAGEDAAQIKGVEEVINRLAVFPNGKPADQDVADQARAAFQRDPMLAGANLQVAVQQRQAVLSGTVNSTFEKARAEEIVSRLNGVTSVQNELRVKP